MYTFWQTLKIIRISNKTLNFKDVSKISEQKIAPKKWRINLKALKFKLNVLFTVNWKVKRLGKKVAIILLGLNEFIWEKLW